MSFTVKSLSHVSKMKYLFIAAIVFFSLVTGVLAVDDVSCYHCHTKTVTEFRNNIHYEKGFTCADCHGGSTMRNNSIISVGVMSGDFVGRPGRENITQICSKCHSSEAADYKQSIHWEEIQKGHPEAATCTDCHGLHEIRAIDDPESPSNHYNSPGTCAECHSNPDIMSAWYYGIKTDRFDTYKESYHWKALKSGYVLVATCADCHGNHNTKSHTDPESSTYPANLPETCGKEGCHPGVNFDAKIAMGLVHDKESLHTGKLVFDKSGLSVQERAYFLGPFDLAYWIAIFFKILTTGVIGFFAIMVFLDLFSRVKIHRRW